MILVEIQNRKEFMNLLLRTDAFDPFRLLKASIRTNACFSVDGSLTEGFYDAEELESSGLIEKEPLPFSMLRQTFFDLIKGKRAPASFQFTLLLSPEKTKELLSASEAGKTNPPGLVMNLNYHDGRLLITTGVSYRVFTMDKEPEHLWDAYAKQFLHNQGILFEDCS